MNCDRIAPFYEWIEKAAFGARLQTHRTAFLDAVAGQQRVLIVGDGDGRFTQALVKAYPDLEIDCVEISAGMVAESCKRLASEENVRIIHCDAFGFAPREAQYDVIFTHFFLDCFGTKKLSVLVRQLSAALKYPAVWIVSDFRQARTGWRRLFTRLWLAIMYLFFRYATGLETRALPEYGPELEAAGFTIRKEQVSMAGLLASEWWQR